MNFNERILINTYLLKVSVKTILKKINIFLLFLQISNYQNKNPVFSLNNSNE